MNLSLRERLEGIGPLLVVIAVIVVLVGAFLGSLQDEKDWKAQCVNNGGNYYFQYDHYTCVKGNAVLGTYAP